MSTVSERARDFWDQISPRERGLVLLGAVAAPLVVMMWLGMSIYDGLTERETKNDLVRKALIRIQEIKARGPQQPADDLVATMPTEPLPLETYLTGAAQTAGFALKGTTPRSPVARNGFVTNSVSLTVNDLTIDQLRRFLQEIETKSKYVAITRLELTRKDYKGKDKLDASLEVSCYAREASKAEGSAADAGAAGKQGG
jgi:type II secretory pathway component PulM